MLKKSITVVLVLAGALALPGAAFAQQQQPPSSSTPTASDQDIQMLRQDIRSQRKQIIAANMQLTDAEATKFWPVYDAYMQDVIKNSDGRFALIKEYAQTYDTMTDAQALSLVKRWGAVDQSFANTRVQWMPKFEAVLPGKKAALFYQIDRRVAQLIDLQLMSMIPLVKQ
jgi:hypothetical protein